MIQDIFSNPLSTVLYFVALVIAITVHEWAHAFTADRLGDPTPSLQGRVTLNPLAHLDPLGTIMLVLFRFGWGKPVQFDPYNLRKPKRDTTLISLAGPASNIVMAILASLLVRVLDLGFLPLSGFIPSLFATFLVQLTIVNIVLAVFNLIPIHPLDGFKIVAGLLPDHYHRQWMELERYGMIFLIALVLPFFGSPITRIISPPINFLLQLLLPVGNFI